MAGTALRLSEAAKQITGSSSLGVEAAQSIAGHPSNALLCRAREGGDGSGSKNFERLHGCDMLGATCPSECGRSCNNFAVHWTIQLACKEVRQITQF